MSHVLDAVINDNYQPVFNSTPENVQLWLETTPLVDDLKVCVGATMEIISVPEYTKRNKKS